jgi:hypothetical protein
MSRKVHVDVVVSIEMVMEEGIEVGDVISDMMYSFTPDQDGVDFTDTQIIDYDVTDSK